MYADIIWRIEFIRAHLHSLKQSIDALPAEAHQNRTALTAALRNSDKVLEIAAANISSENPQKGRFETVLKGQDNSTRPD